MDGEIDLRETDVLILGGGLAGCWAAIRARDFVKDVTLIDKAMVGKSGASVFAHTMLAPTPPGDMAAWREEFVRRGEFFNDQDWLDVLFREEGRRIEDLVRWGVPFLREREGQLHVTTGFGHQVTRELLCDGHKLMEVMRNKVLEAGVNLVERVMVTDLLTSDGKHPSGGRVVGAVGFHGRTGDPVVYRSRSVVIATGRINAKMKGHFTYNITGDGTAMAYRAGAELSNMEFSTSGGLAYVEKRYHVGGPALVVGLGAKFINGLGERFMERYSPQLKERSRLSLLCQAMVKEVLEGRGPIYYDWRSLKEEDIQKIRQVRPQTIRPLDEGGIDPRRQLLECHPLITLGSGNCNGGINIDAHSQSSIPGLYAVGAATRSPVQGTFTVSGVNLAYCNVGGYIAGENAGREAAGGQMPTLIDGQLRALLDSIFGPLGKKEGISPEDILDKVNRIVIPAPNSVVKSASRIGHVLERISEIEARHLPRIAADDHHSLVKAHEIRNIVLLAKIVFTSALYREESRHWHYREEFPYRDDRNWLKWTVVKRLADDAVSVEARPIPIERYPVQPGEWGKIPHPVQFLPLE